MKIQYILLAIIFFFSCLIALGNSQIHKHCPDKPVLSTRLGFGYNRYYGNPLSEKHYTQDRGFRQKALEQTFSQCKMTSDKQYLVPDMAYAYLQRMCQQRLSENVFHGTKEYRQSLDNLVQIQGSGSKGGFSGQFSLSKAWGEVNSATFTNDETMIDIRADCQQYVAGLNTQDLRKQKISENFAMGVRNAYRNKRWDHFFDTFGTDYIKKVTVGGRYVHTISIKGQSQAKIREMHMDIKTMAKASYAGTFKASVTNRNSFSRSQQARQYFSSISTQKSKIFIGGESNSPDASTWMGSVRHNAVPIKYTLSSLKNLFRKFLSGSELNYYIQSFDKGLIDYCKSRKCAQKLTNRDPARIEIYAQRWTHLYGGWPEINYDPDVKSHWRRFNLQNELNHAKQYEFHVSNKKIYDLSEVCIRSGWWIDQLQVIFSNGINIQKSGEYGGSGPGRLCWKVPPGQQIWKIHMRRFWAITKLQFRTTRNNLSPSYGSERGLQGLESLHSDEYITAIKGRSLRFLYSLSFQRSRRRIIKSDITYST